MLKGTFTNCKGPSMKRPASFIAALAVFLVVAAWAGQGVAAGGSLRSGLPQPLENRKEFNRLTPLHWGMPGTLDLTVYLVDNNGLGLLKTMPEAWKATALALDGPRITDAGLAQLSVLSKLRQLELNCPSVEGPGLRELAKLPELEWLEFWGCPIDDASLVHLTKLSKLHNLGLAQTSVADAGMPTLAKIKNLGVLDLSKTKVTDAGLVHLRGLPLSRLYLQGNDITDAGLKTLSGIRTLSYLNLTKTKVTSKGLMVLRGRPSTLYVYVDRKLLTPELTAPEVQEAGLDVDTYEP
jgi:hypothetical protein